MHYICIKKNHLFISASSEKIHAFIHSNMHFSKKTSPKFHNAICQKKKEGKKKGKCGESFIHRSLNLQECE